MARLLRMPEVAANATEAVLQEWTVEDGASFDDQQTIATVETEKAVVDVEAEGAGTVLKLMAPAGSTVEVGAPIAVIGDPGENVDDLDRILADLGVTETDHAPAPERRTVPQPELERPKDPGPSGGVPSTGDGAARPSGRVFASPIARKMAREAELGIEELEGTGPGGRIVRRDVEQAIARKEQRATVPRTESATQDAASGAAYDDQPHSRMRTAIAARLTESKQTIPHFYLRTTLRADRLLRLRAELNDGAEVRISVNDLLVKAVAKAHTLVPAMNAIWTPGAMRRFSGVDVAVAVATPAGLVTPVLRAVDRMPITTVAAAARDLADRARERRLAQHELEGGACTVTNLGMYGTEEFAAIINPPQSSILAVGAAREEPVVVDDEIRAATVMRVTLSVDHRAVDGALAAEWMRELVRLVERPAQILS